MDKKVAVGYTKKPLGLKGELRLSVDDEYIEDVSQAKIVFIEVKGKPVPYFVEQMRFQDTLIVKFEDVNSKEEARQLSSLSILLFEKDIIPQEQRILEVEELEFEKYLGFKIIDELKGEIGKIERVEEFPQQEMAIIKYEEREIMIPMNEQFITHIDEQKQSIQVQLPDGLLAL